ncbi:MAG: hypothetical protein HYV07_31545 [Deltaproteobacteria bacterium]|nr:hypothetical protein [Deltaproteobacteria bacterium]
MIERRPIAELEAERAASARTRELFRAVPDPPTRGPVFRAFRRLVREVLWVFVEVLDLGRRFGAWLLRSEYVRAGACQKRGVCCEHILLEWTDAFDRYPWLARLFMWKMTRIYSFFDRGYSWEVEDGLVARVLGCHALREDGSCGEYRTRPSICRAYPEVPLIGKSLLHKGCGFKFVRRDGTPEPEDQPEDVPIVRTGDLIVLRRRPVEPAKDRSSGHEGPLP